MQPRVPLACTSAPVITTERLLLAQHNRGDWEDSAAMWADAEVVRFIGGRVSTREESWGRLLRYAGLWSLLGYGYWCIRDRSAGRFVGELGFADFKRSMSPGLGATPEAGWALASWAHGRGMAREALAAALSWADGNIGSRTACMIDDGNAASIRLAQCSGFQAIGPACYKGVATRLYERVNVEP